MKAFKGWYIEANWDEQEAYVCRKGDPSTVKCNLLFGGKAMFTYSIP